MTQYKKILAALKEAPGTTYELSLETGIPIQSIAAVMTKLRHRVGIKSTRVPSWTKHSGEIVYSIDPSQKRKPPVTVGDLIVEEVTRRAGTARSLMTRLGMQESSLTATLAKMVRSGRVNTRKIFDEHDGDANAQRVNQYYVEQT